MTDTDRLSDAQCRVLEALAAGAVIEAHWSRAAPRAGWPIFVWYKSAAESPRTMTVGALWRRGFVRRVLVYDRMFADHRVYRIELSPLTKSLMEIGRKQAGGEGGGE